MNCLTPFSVVFSSALSEELMLKVGESVGGRVVIADGLVSLNCGSLRS